MFRKLEYEFQEIRTQEIKIQLRCADESTAYTWAHSLDAFACHIIEAQEGHGRNTSMSVLGNGNGKDAGV